MFTQFSLSLNSSNYTFKIKLDESAIEFFNGNKDLINVQIESMNQVVVTDQYVGEIVGLSLNEATEDFMIKELNRWKKFFESHGLSVYEPRVVALKTRLADLKQLSEKNKELLVDL